MIPFNKAGVLAKEIPRRRRHQFDDLVHVSSSSKSFSNDPSHMPLTNLHSTEMYVIIIAGSLPTLRPLLQNSLSKWHSYKQRSSKGYHASDDQDHELHPYKKRHIHASAAHGLGLQTDGSDREVLADSDPHGITKTVDFTLEATQRSREQRSEGSNEDHPDLFRVRETERV